MYRIGIFRSCHVGAIGKIILIDILLAGDNAVVIGMAAGKLAPELQKKAVIWGTVGAIVMRLVFATLLVEALTLIPLIHLGGGTCTCMDCHSIIKRWR